MGHKRTYLTNQQKQLLEAYFDTLADKSDILSGNRKAACDAVGKPPNATHKFVDKDGVWLSAPAERWYTRRLQEYNEGGLTKSAALEVAKGEIDPYSLQRNLEVMIALRDDPDTPATCRTQICKAFLKFHGAERPAEDVDRANPEDALKYAKRLLGLGETLSPKS